MLSEEIKKQKALQKPQPTTQPEILDYDANTGEVIESNPYDLLQTELINRRVSEGKAENIVTRYTKEQVKAFLNDPSSIDSLVG
ncbi:hypothetical protein CMUC_1168 [Campylobacter mucosalis CCUG 21559]|uniref:Uncharacterized protein n=1 Tax=Campylobacter mucosalis CCUG 21559 TaxID=1032067 RepID=A0A6G5QH33_9BACT|nr:hypothetical protein CMUC_1168 [Campylobacter mucosalis CCUG 21559]